MNLVKVRDITQVYAFPQDLSRMVGYKDLTKILRRYREFCDARPNYFLPRLPYIKEEGSLTHYDVLCFAHYFENRSMLDAGSKSLSFKKDLPRLREAYDL